MATMTEKLTGRGIRIMRAMKRWPGALQAVDRATEFYGDVIEAVDVEDRGGMLYAVLGVKTWRWLLHPIRVARATRAAEVAVIRWEGKVEIRPIWSW